MSDPVEDFVRKRDAAMERDDISCDPHTGTADQKALIGPAVGRDGSFWWVEFIAKLPDVEAAP